MPPEMIDLMSGMGGGGVAGAIAYAVVRIVEVKTGLPRIQAELDAVRKLHEACEANVRNLQAQLTQLIEQLALPRG